MFKLIVAGIRRMPTDMYPVYGMISIAMGFGVYVATKKIGWDQDLIIRSDRGYNPDHWKLKVDEWEKSHKQSGQQ
ncbi:hypothetical protein HK096_005838 [Nowakowskiella sp. JEL0078]|nr:hypothetical protein HK096_005838 [Nowakowskiella sp. JEL0078]